MEYKFEEIKVNKSKKQVVVYIIILLLALIVSIIFGMQVAKEYNINKVKQYNTSELRNNTEKNNSDTMVIISEGDKKTNEISSIQNNVAEQNKVQGQQKQEQSNNKNKFIENVKDIYNGEEGKRVFLTFDDGPSKAVTPHILDKLKEYNIKATFFVLGSRVKTNPQLVKRAYDEGHYIANHGYSHKYSKIYANTNAVFDEYNKTEIEIQKALENSNYSSNLFRFPGGSFGGQYSRIKKEIKKEIKKNNIAYLDWNALTNDAAGANTKEKIMKNLKNTVGNKNNVVVLMHDAPDKILTYETLGEVITYLKDKGYAFKNMYDLM